MKPSYQLLPLGTPFYLYDLLELFADMPYISFVSTAEIDEKLPLLVLYYGENRDDKTRPYDIDLNVKARNQEVMPIVKDVTKFAEYIPDSLREINAFVLDGETQIHNLKNRILSWFGLLDNTRKIFISYKRSDTSALAHQLFDALIKMGYIPFLDSYSIESGVNFQEYLMNEISDADMFIMLNSSEYDQSEYTKAELVAASKLGIGILQVKFPKSKTFLEADISAILQLDEQLQKDQEYAPKIVEDIIYNMERYRAQGYRTKRRILIDGLKSKYSNQGLSTLEDGSILVNASQTAYHPITHVPTSEDLELAYNSMEKLSLPDEVVKKICYYGIHCRSDKRSHLDWLNTCNLPVTSEDISL